MECKYGGNQPRLSCSLIEVIKCLYKKTKIVQCPIILQIKTFGTLGNNRK